MVNRVVGQNSGIDVDTVVKQSLSNEQNRIDKAYQKQKVAEYEQEQLKTIVESGKEFNSKYFDLLTSGNLMSETAYETVKFTSDDESESVTAKGYAGADVTDYKVNVNQIAKKAEKTLKSNYFDSAIDSKSGVLSFEMKNANDGTSKFAYIDLPIENGELDMKSVASKLNAELKRKGINANAKYSEFAKGIVLESNEYGENVSFGVALKKPATQATEGENISKDDKKPEGFNFEYCNGQNAKGIITKGNYVYQIDRASNIVLVDNVEFKFNSESKLTPEPDNFNHLDSSDIDNTVTQQSLDGKIKYVTNGEKNILSKTYSDGITIKTTEDSDSISTSITGKLTHLAKDEEDAEVVEKNGITTITKKIKEADGTSRTKQTIIEVNNKKTTITTTDEYDGVKIKTVTTKEEDADGVESAKNETTCEGGSLSTEIIPDNHKTIIESSDGNTKTTIINGFDENGKSKETTSTIRYMDGKSVEKVTTKVDGVSTTTVNSVNTVTLNGKTDIKDLKDTIVKFVDDYNKLMKSINDKLWEKRDKDYMPLTDSQKSEMTDKQVEAWEEKAKTGLLRSDSDLRRIQQSMKNAMSTFMSGTGLTLENIGIKPVKDYTTKNGMLEIDDSTLTKALENNSEEVKDLFIRKASGKEDKGGALTQLKEVFKNEITSSDSMLSKRIGYDGTSTASNNTLTNTITKQKKLIKELKSKYTTKETALYKKYSNLEVMLEKLNAQQNSLTSLLGIN